MSYLLDIIPKLYKLWITLLFKVLFIPDWMWRIIFPIFLSEILLIAFYCMVFYYNRNRGKIRVKSLSVTCLIISFLTSLLFKSHLYIMGSSYLHHFFSELLTDFGYTFIITFIVSWLSDRIAQRFSWPRKAVVFSLALIIISLIILLVWLLYPHSYWKEPLGL